ncbi:indolepyruvate ferredoxin oxidoreductase subunit alpha, partial [Microbacterium sp. K36]|uniref:indolepyruvate ferredoxin oxidoreductase subunit alpha n=1 Tax=Microbacterium sp. K36 TaxID=2305439 RepID=UPI001F112028
MTYVIALPCVDLKDKACIDECPVDCIYEGERSLYIHPDECVDCGACEPVCPVEATRDARLDVEAAEHEHRHLDQDGRDRQRIIAG